MGPTSLPFTSNILDWRLIINLQSNILEVMTWGLGDRDNVSGALDLKALQAAGQWVHPYIW